jgi:hypothetical protein
MIINDLDFSQFAEFEQDPLVLARMAQMAQDKGLLSNGGGGGAPPPPPPPGINKFKLINIIKLNMLFMGNSSK